MTSDRGGMRPGRLRAWRWLGVALVAVLLPAVFVGLPRHADPGSSAASPPSSGTVTAPAASTVQQSYDRIPLSFEANAGQTDKSVKFVSRGRGYGLFLTGNAAVLSLSKRPALPEPSTHPVGRPAFRKEESQRGQSAIINMTLSGANAQAQVEGLEPLPGKANYFIGNDPKKWRTNVPTYGKVKYKDVYPGIDLVYYGKDRQLEYDFVLAPGADPKAIVLDLTNRPGGRPAIDANGDLILSTGDDEVRLLKPAVYQAGPGSSNPDRKSVEGRFVLLSANRIGFDIGDYDKSRPLVIDPVLKYSTYYGGSDFDAISATALTGSDGIAYITGETGSLADFPTNLDLSPNNGTTSDFFNVDAFVAKINADGTGYIWSTYLGGTAQDSGHGIAVDGTADVYITGGTNSSDFPMKNAYQDDYPDSGVGEAVFVTKIDSDGSSILYSTYLIGYNNNEGHAIAADDEGNAYVTGLADGPANGDNAFPQKNGFVTDQCSAYAVEIGGDDFNQMSGFITRIDTTQSGDDSLRYSTVFCGFITTVGNAIATDGTVHSTGNAFVTGKTHWADFPIKNGLPISCDGCNLTPYHYDKAFVMKVDTNQSGSSSIAYSTLLGGSNNLGDEGRGIAVDGNGKAYVIGLARSQDFPVTAGALQTQYKGDDDAFIAKIDPGESGAASLVWSTYLGGSGTDFGTGIALGFQAASGNRDIYVTGGTNSTDFPTRNAPQPAFGGGNENGPEVSSDAFVARIKPDGSKLLYSTYLGGSDNERLGVGLEWSSGPAIAVDFSNNVYVAGGTKSTDFPVGTAGVNAMFTTLQGSADGFITKLTLNPDFSMSAIPAMTMDVAGSDTKSAQINSLDSFNADVTLSDPPPPSGFTTSFNSSPATPPADDSVSYSVTVGAGPSVAAGSYTLNVVGTSGTLTHSTPLSVTVNATAAGVTTVIGQDQALGCIDNSGISNALTTKLAQAQAAIKAGDIQTAINILSALLHELQAQAGKHVSHTCTDQDGNSFDAVQVLIDDVTALLTSIGGKLKPNPLMGTVAASSGVAVSGATVTILNGTKIVASTTTDSTGFYFFAKTSVFSLGKTYTVKVTPSKPYKTSTPASRTFTWAGGELILGSFVLN